MLAKMAKVFRFFAAELAAAPSKYGPPIRRAGGQANKQSSLQKQKTLAIFLF